MKAGIITIPEREESLNRLLDIIIPEVPDVYIFTDYEHKGPWWNEWRMFVDMLTNAEKGEPVLLMTDDAITISGFRKLWEDIHYVEQSSLYTLFSRQRNLFTEENVARGYVTKVQPRGFYDIAAIYIDQQDLPRKVLSWLFDSDIDSLPPRVRKLRSQGRHIDVVIQDYFVYHDIPWTITTPTLFDHQATKSTLGHNVGGSPRYIGDTV